MPRTAAVVTLPPAPHAPSTIRLPCPATPALSPRGIKGMTCPCRGCPQACPAWTRSARLSGWLAPQAGRAEWPGECNSAKSQRCPACDAAAGRGQLVGTMPPPDAAAVTPCTPARASRRTSVSFPSPQPLPPGPGLAARNDDHGRPGTPGLPTSKAAPSRSSLDRPGVRQRLIPAATLTGAGSLARFPPVHQQDRTHESRKLAQDAEEA